MFDEFLQPEPLDLLERRRFPVSMKSLATLAHGGSEFM
jgi:hypothetical protein